MKLGDAIEIVMTLARDNILSEQEAQQDLEILLVERGKQVDACNIIEDYFVNKVFG